MRDDDYVRSWYGNGKFNLRDALRNLDGKAVDHSPPTISDTLELHAYEKLRDVWDGYRDAPNWSKPAPTALAWVLRVGGFSFKEVGAEAGLSHTTVLRLARDYGVPHRSPYAWRKGIKYMNSELIRLGFRPVTAREVFPFRKGENHITRKTYEKALKVIEAR